MRPHVHLPAEFTDAHADVLKQYLQDERALFANQWAQVLEAIDLLRAATLAYPGGTETFAALYNRVVDIVYADVFIEQLLAMDDQTTQSEPLRAALARRVLRDLRQMGLYDPGIRDTQLLVAFCVFWWQSFTKGYAFEVEIFHDHVHFNLGARPRDSVMRHCEERFLRRSNPLRTLEIASGAHTAPSQ
jgi:hypothetical protein